MQALLAMKARYYHLDTAQAGSRSHSAAADGRGSAGGGSRGSGGGSGADYKRGGGSGGNAGFESYVPAHAEYSRDAKSNNGGGRGGGGGDYMSIDNDADEYDE